VAGQRQRLVRAASCLPPQLVLTTTAGLTLAISSQAFNTEPHLTTPSLSSPEPRSSPLIALGLWASLAVLHDNATGP
jgi:hypothetical protein